MDNFYLIFGFIYWLFCYAYIMTYIKEYFLKQNEFGMFCIIALMMLSCVVVTPFNIGSNLADVFIKMEEKK